MHCYKSERTFENIEEVLVLMVNITVLEEGRTG